MRVPITTRVIWREADDLQSAVAGSRTNIVFVCEASVCPLPRPAGIVFPFGTYFHLSLHSLN